jgi:hypothetical protein
MSFVTRERFEAGTLLDVTVKLPDRARRMKATAAVVWTRPSYEGCKSYQEPNALIGVKFVKIDPKDCELLARYAKISTPPEA